MRAYDVPFQEDKLLIPGMGTQGVNQYDTCTFRVHLVMLGSSTLEAPFSNRAQFTPPASDVVRAEVCAVIIGSGAKLWMNVIVVTAPW